MQSRSDVEGRIVSDGGGQRGAVEESFGESELTWEIACSLLKADSYTNRALEEHVFRMCRENADPRSTEEYLEQALNRHREIVEELEYALDAVEN
jgi:hypothetical protein